MGGGEGEGYFSWVVANVNHMFFLVFLYVTTGEVWVTPTFRIWGNKLHVEHISCVITKWRQYQRVVPFSFLNSYLGLDGENITKRLLYLSSDLSSKKFCHSSLLSLYFVQSLLLSLLSSGWVVFAVYGTISFSGRTFRHYTKMHYIHEMKSNGTCVLSTGTHLSGTVRETQAL